MTEPRWGPASGFLNAFFRAGTGADNAYAALRGTSLALSRADVRSAYRDMRAESLQRNQVTQLRNETIIPAAYHATGSPHMRDRYRYDMIISVLQKRTDAAGNVVWEKELRNRSIGSDERLSKSDAGWLLSDTISDAYAESAAMVRVESVSQAWERPGE